MLRMRNSFTLTPFFSTLKMLEMPNTNTNQQGKNSFHSVEESYQKAVITLNRLPSNKQVLADPESCQHPESKRRKVISFFAKCGLNIDEIEDKLSIIHVAGTKGKGSTCAYCEAILKQHGYKTGFYSSPYLVSVRETIRINGQQLSQQKFSDYFWKIYRKLCSHDNYKNVPEMPPYFTFLTVMAFQAFMAEKVDVAIIEVGIGGEYDCTNVLRKTAVVGITSLGFDHVNLLGNTIEEIAWQKAGIMKPNCIAITAPDQPPAALKILKERALEKKCNLFIAPNLEKYFNSNDVSLGICSPAQSLNASLGAQLANAWLNPQLYHKFHAMSYAPIFPLSNEMRLGLSNCHWPGRTQIFPYSNKLIFYFDGAHNTESIQNCVTWFQQCVPQKSKKVLVFNMTGGRDGRLLMKHLIQCHFNYAFFCPNIIDCNENSYLEIIPENKSEEIEMSKQYYSQWLKMSTCDEKHAELFYDVSTTLKHLENNLSKEESHVLVTGSLHLVGAFIALINANSNENNYQ